MHTHINKHTLLFQLCLLHLQWFNLNHVWMWKYWKYNENFNMFILIVMVCFAHLYITSSSYRWEKVNSKTIKVSLYNWVNFKQLHKKTVSLEYLYCEIYFRFSNIIGWQVLRKGKAQISSITWTLTFVFKDNKTHLLKMM